LKVFISHSRQDDKIVKIVETEIKDKGHTPYLAEKAISSERMEEKLASNISASNIVLVLWTNNVARRRETRDMVLWEIILGKHLGRKVIVFLDEKLKASPVIEQLVVYNPLNFKNKTEIKKVVRGFISQNLKTDEDIYNEFLELTNKLGSTINAVNEIMKKYGYSEDQLAKLITTMATII